VSELLDRLVRLFVEAPASRETLPELPSRRPTVAVLCTASCAPAAVAMVALALARGQGTPCALVAGSGRPSGGAVAVPSARRAAALLRTRGEDATAAGRLVSLANLPASEHDPVGTVAAASVALARATAIACVPGAVVIPLARSDALDRVLRWHDAIVAICEPGVADPLAERVNASLAELGRPVVAMPPPGRQAAAFARLGLRAPSWAVARVAELAAIAAEEGRS
jgi:hypothetical protein